MYSTEVSRPILGILGGLGPLSSAYFYELITAHTKAVCDQEHIDIILSSHAATPDRTAYILGRSKEDPLPYMLEDAKKLERYGAAAIVIPCNTAHYFIDEVRRSVKVPVPSIISETALHIYRCGYRSACILATEGTVSSGSYQSEFDRLGIKWNLPDTAGQETLMDIIYNDVKVGRIPPSDKLFSITEPMFRNGADCVVLGCTELSLLKRQFKYDMRYVDSLEVLASAAIRLFGHDTVGFTPDFDLEEAK